MTPALFYLLVAVGLISAELLILQFTVFWFFFLGVGAFITALICWFMPELSFGQSTLLFSASSVVAGLVLYSPLKRWQNKPSPIAGNDAIGQSAVVTEAINAEKAGKVVWSGTDWPAQLAENESALAVGETAVIRKLEGIRLIVGR